MQGMLFYLEIRNAHPHIHVGYVFHTITEELHDWYIMQEAAEDPDPYNKEWMAKKSGQLRFGAFGSKLAEVEY